MTQQSSFARSTPSASQLAANVCALFPVSKRMRWPAASTSAAKPQSFVSADLRPKASFRIVMRSATGARLRVDLGRLDPGHDGHPAFVDAVARDLGAVERKERGALHAALVA